MFSTQLAQRAVANNPIRVGIIGPHLTRKIWCGFGGAAFTNAGYGRERDC